MYWYSELLNKEFVDYFSNENSIYFTVTAKGKMYNDIYDKFKGTIYQLMLLSDNGYNFKDIYHSIKGNVFDCDISSLSVDQLAVGLMFPFASRMGGSFEDEFAESGRLRQFILALYNKSSN